MCFVEPWTGSLECLTLSLRAKLDKNWLRLKQQTLLQKANVRLLLAMRKKINVASVSTKCCMIKISLTVGKAVAKIFTCNVLNIL